MKATEGNQNGNSRLPEAKVSLLKFFAGRNDETPRQMGSQSPIIISQVPPPHHGSTVMTSTLLRVLADLRLNPRLVDRRFSHSVDEVGHPSLKKIFASVSLLVRLIRELIAERPSYCIFFVTTRPGSFLVDWSLSEVLRLFRVRTVNYIHTQGFSDLASRNRVWRGLVGRVLGGATLTVSLGPSLLEDVRKYVQGDLICIPNTSTGFATQPSRVPIRSDHKQVVFLSNLIPSKGADTFVDAAIQLSKRFPRVDFQVVGADSDEEFSRELREKVLRAGFDRRIHFLGAAYGDAKWSILNSATLLAYPSRYDAQPLTIIEALSCGVPVVAYETGGIGDLVADDTNGFLIPAGDLDKFVDRCAAVIDDDQLRGRLGAEARLSFEANYSEEAYKAAWRTAIDGLY